MAYGGFKELTSPDKILSDITFSIAKNSKYDGYQRDIASMVHKLFDKKVSGGAATFTRSETLATRNKYANKNENISNKELAEELHKTIIKKFKKKKYSHLL